MQQRYDFIKQLPSGGFGNVAVLFDRQLQRQVVVKSLIMPSRENRQRFVREAEILFSLRSHEHVVDIIDAKLGLMNPCIVLEYCQHGTLQDWVSNRGLFGPSEINVGYAVQHAALGLHAIHERNGFHRDLKPANLFIGENKTGQLTVKLGDFGFGRLPYPHTLSDVTHHACGTIGYIAPELYRADAMFTQACDVFSLGITGIELLAGSREIDSLNSAWIFNNELKRLLLEMTKRNAAERPTALEVAQRIKLVEKKSNDNAKAVVFGGLALIGIGLLLGGQD
jgi:serine/threonine protein kinase